MAILNELLEEAAGRAMELSEEATEAAQAIDALIQRVGSLSEALAAEGEEAHRHFQDLEAKLGEAEGELETAGQNAVSSLEGLGTKAVEVQGRVGEMLATIKKDLADLEAKKDELSGTFDLKVQDADADFDELSQQVQKLEAATDQHLQAAEAAISEFREAVATAREEFETGKNHLLEAMDELETSAQEQTHLYVESVETALTAQTIALIDLENRMKDAHNEAVVALRKKFAEEAVQQVGSAIVPLEEAMEALAGLCPDHEAALLQRANEIRGKFELAVQMIEQNRPVLDAAIRLQR